MSEFLADNIYIRAIVNAITLVGFVTLLIAGGKRVLKFLRWTYATSVRSALYCAYQKERRAALISAVDLHVYVTLLLGRGLLVFTSALAMLVTDAASTSPPADSLVRQLSGFDVETYGSIRAVGLGVMSTTFFLTMVAGVVKTITLLRNVARYRLRWRSRRTLREWPSEHSALRPVPDRMIDQ